MMPPKISVCVPTYNYARYLPEAIESILGQTFTDFELLIIDDNSTDDTVDIVSKYAAIDARIKFYVNDVNIGMVENWNLCLTRATGEYIKFVFGDDLLCSRDALQKMALILEGNKAVSLVASSRNLIDAHSRPIKNESRFRKDTILTGVKVIERCLKEQKNLIGEPTVVMFRKKDATRGFKSHYTQIVDLEMWFHLLEQGDFAYIREPLTAFRQHQSQQTNKNSGRVSSLRDLFYMYDEYMGKDYLTISKLHKKFIRFDNVNEFWKLYKKGLISKNEAIANIDNYCDSRKFILLLPLYYFCRHYYKIKKAICRFML